MAFRFVALVLLAFSTRVSALEFPLEIVDQFDNARVVTYVNKSDFDKAPAWNPANGAPPLSVGDMLMSLDSWTVEDSTLKGAQVSKIELKPILLKEKQGHWYYLVKLTCKTTDTPKAAYAAILMNGKVFAAIREPDPFK